MKWIISQEEFDKLTNDDRASGHFRVEPSIEAVTSKIFKKDDHYIDIKDKHLPDLEKALDVAGFKIWSEFHANSQGNPLEKLTSKSRRFYETFCGGFLYFYDHQLYSNQAGKDAGYLKQLYNDHGVVTQPVIDYFKQKLADGLLDHTLFFLWLRDKDHFPVRIYLNPPAGNPDPPSGPAPPPPESNA
jgi:hypothetical protein